MSQETSAPLSISLDTARTLAVVKQGLHQRPTTADKDTLLETICRINLLQLDTINVVARSHYLVMLSRVGPYDRADLDALLYPDRRLFEGWAHAACMIPVEDYAHFAPLILAYREQPTRYEAPMRVLGDDPQAVLNAVLAKVRERGPLCSKDFQDTRDERGSWWDFKPAKHALKMLYDRGYLMVDRRVNFQIYYDLAERVLPASAEPPSKTVDDWRRWATLRSVACFGVATAAHASEYYSQKKTATRAMIRTLKAEGAVVPVNVKGWEDQAYVVPDDLPLIQEIANGAHRPTLTALLSPFDNLTWSRRRLSELFGFDYRIEMYTPAPKRKYGYYVMPILHRGRLVGRLDPKADRKTKTLVIRSIYLEPGESITDELLAGVSGALREFVAFHDCQDLTIERSEPQALRQALLDVI